MTYNDILNALFESTVLPPSKTLCSASDLFEPNESHPFDWAVDDPIVSADPDLVASQLRRKINYGVLDPTSGEAQARAHGCAPLNVPPNPETFDVASQSRWTLTMALAWVMWRNFDAVRAVKADWIAAHHTWVAWEEASRHTASTRALFEEALGTRDIPYDDERRGWVLVPVALAPHAVLVELAAHGLEGVVPEQDLTSAKAQIWSSLLDGKIKSEGRLTTGGWTRIAPVEWNGLRLTTSDRLPTDCVLGDTRSYDEVRSSVPAVLKMWPETAAQPRHLKSGDFKLKDKKAITASVGALLNVDPSSRKEDIEAHLREAGWSFSERFYDQGIWRVVVDEFPTLTKPGPRKKSPS